MSLTQQEEFKLVAQLRKFASSIAIEIKPNTANEYQKVYQRLLDTNQLPEHARSRSDYYRRRAAMLFVCSIQAKVALRNRDKAGRGTKEWDDAMKEILRITQIFNRYPPDPDRKRKDSCPGGDGAVRWHDVQVRLRASGFEPIRRSKRQSLDSLLRRHGWQDSLMDHISSKHRDSLAIAILTGARPSEIAQGVTVKVTNEGLVVTVPGAKLGRNRGQPFRSLLISIACPTSKYLASLAEEGVITVASDAKCFSDAVTQAGKRAFPRSRNNISPYSLRHAVASALKASGVDDEGIAMALGHRATASQQVYGRASHAKSKTSILGVQAALPVVQTGSDPSLIGRKHSPSPRRR